MGVLCELVLQALGRPIGQAIAVDGASVRVSSCLHLAQHYINCATWQETSSDAFGQGRMQ